MGPRGDDQTDGTGRDRVTTCHIRQDNTDAIWSSCSAVGVHVIALTRRIVNARYILLLSTSVLNASSAHILFLQVMSRTKRVGGQDIIIANNF